MLSTGKFHEQVPREPAANLAYRAALLALCRDEPEFRAAVVEMSKNDILFYINCFGWQYNPDNFDEEVGPFITWPAQEEAILETLQVLLVNREDMLWEKSRRQGGTWCALFVQDWVCRHFKNKKFLDISHSEQAVWRPEDKDSLFWKLHFIDDHIPKFFGGTVRRKMGLHYPATDSGINGAATTERSGVGGRGVVILDEFAKQRDDVAIWGHTRYIGPRLVISTHYGTGTKFFNLCQNHNIRRIVWHWTQHPDLNKGLYQYSTELKHLEVMDKSYEFPPTYPFVMDGRPLGGPFPGIRSPWYDKESMACSPRDLAMNVDIDAQGSQSQVFDPSLIRRLQASCCPPYFEGDLSYDPDLGTPRHVVKRVGGDLKFWCQLDSQGNPPRRLYGAGADVSQGTGATNSCFSIFDAETGEKVLEWANSRVSPEQFAPLAVALCRLFATKDGSGAKLIWENVGPGTKFGRVVVDDLGYRNLYYRTDELSLSKTVSDSPGWVPNPTSKLNIIRDYMVAMAEGECTNRSHQALEECLDFEYDKSGRVVHSGESSVEDPSGARENHGDRVMADAMAWKMARDTVVTSAKVREERAVEPGHDSFLARRLLRERKKRDEEEFSFV